VILRETKCTDNNNGLKPLLPLFPRYHGRHSHQIGLLPPALLLLPLLSRHFKRLCASRANSNQPVQQN